MRRQRVLVTGGSGFIGSHVVRLLWSSGRDVALLSRTGRRPMPDDPRSSALTLLPYPATDASALRHSIRDWAPDALIHLAWSVEPGEYLHSPNNLTSLTASLDLLSTVIDAGCARIAMAGTCAEYDVSRGWLKEDGPTRPDTLYGATKLSLCLIAEKVAIQRGAHLTWGRIFFPYGPGEDARRAVPALIRALLAGQRFSATSGEQIRDYIHVEDVAAAFVALIDSDERGVFNVSSGVPVSMRQVMETIGDVIGAADLIDFDALPQRAWDPMFICGQNSRLRTTGWRPTISLRHGLEQTVAWWRARQEPASQHGP